MESAENSGSTTSRKVLAARRRASSLPRSPAGPSAEADPGIPSASAHAGLTHPSLLGKHTSCSALSRHPSPFRTGLKARCHLPKHLSGSQHQRPPDPPACAPGFCVPLSQHCDNWLPTHTPTHPGPESTLRGAPSWPHSSPHPVRQLRQAEWVDFTQLDRPTGLLDGHLPAAPSQPEGRGDSAPGRVSCCETCHFLQPASRPAGSFVCFLGPAACVSEMPAPDRASGFTLELSIDHLQLGGLGQVAQPP